MSESKHSDVLDGKNLTIQWESGKPALFANHMMVQVDEFECHLSFYEIQPPVIQGTPEEKKEQLDRLTSIQARCVARVVVSRERVPGLVLTLQSVLAQMIAAEGKANEV